MLRRVRQASGPVSLRWPRPGRGHPWRRARGENHREANESRRTTPRELPAL